MKIRFVLVLFLLVWLMVGCNLLTEQVNNIVVTVETEEEDAITETEDEPSVTVESDTSLLEISTISHTSSTITFDWTFQDDDAIIDSLMISYSGDQEEGIDPASGTYSLSGLSSSTVYSITFYAVDIAGGEWEKTTMTLSTSSSSTSVEIEYISDAAGLAGMADDLAGSYFLTSDIDLDGVDWTPIGDDSSYFTGALYGNDCTISNLTVGALGSNYQGLFGYIYDGVVTDLTLDECTVYGGESVGALGGYVYSSTISGCSVTDSSYVEGDGNSVGGLIGYSRYTSLVDCSSEADVTGGLNYTGGLIGYQVSGTLSGCYSTGTVNAGDGNYAGGLIGRVLYVNEITDCYSTSTVIGHENEDTYYLGGLIGGCYSATGSALISECYATGYIERGYSYCGGLIGSFNASVTIINCFATGDVDGSCSNWSIGGLFGSFKSGTISDSYATGDVAGESEVGGLIGECSYSAEVTTSYSIGTASGTLTDSSGVGGLVGAVDDDNGTVTISDCYYEEDSSASYDVDYGTSLSTSQMKSSANYTNWDFSDTWVIDGTEAINSGYPYLLDNAPGL
ncbi:MAG: GLUG motif-containing protein [Spirochaetales bacterium]|nr:GLUG motif-containing protein [Spirochaetales bacterium]